MKEQANVQARVKNIIGIYGLKFKDLNGDGKLDKYEDWRLPAEERAKDLVSQMNIDEKVGLLAIQSKPMGISQKDKSLTSHDGVLDEEEKEKTEKEGGGMEYGTTHTIENMHMRHFIVRENTTPSNLATWINTMNEVAEGTRLGIPMIVASNSKNENGSTAYNEKDVLNKFTAWPGTLGLASAGNLDLITEFAENGKKEWDATGIKKGYMYMADIVTDPRWFRIFGTFGENPTFIGDAMKCIIEAYQGKEIKNDSIALTIKHFPGGGARENGFDPHYKEGKFNVYPTKGSLEKYHLPPFKAAIAANPSSIMPYYAIPSNEKSAVPQAPFIGEFEEVGFAYNKAVITDVLRAQLGFKGYVNSDSGVLGKMAWGAEELTKPERIGKAFEAGTDMFSGTNEVAEFRKAYDQGLLYEERINLSVERLLKEMFQLGLFENPYRNPENADNVVSSKESEEKAYKAHQQSVVLLKNKDNILPLTDEKLEGKKVYVEYFTKVFDEKKLEMMLKSGVASDPKKTIAAFPGYFKEGNPDITFTEDYKEADYALLYLEPSSGDYFEATPSYLELNIMAETGIDVDKIKAIREAVPNIVMSVNFHLPWLMTNVEPLADVLLAGFDTFASATMAVIRGRFNPTGKMPLTLPGSDEAIAVDGNGICASPNDVPGYDKEKYMNGKPYTYVDSEGNKYRLGFGLHY